MVLKISSRKFLLSLIFSFFFGLTLLAQNGFPDDSHPRIFLNDEVIQTLVNRMNSNTLQWQMFNQYLSDYLNDEPWGTQYLDAIPSYSLAYLMTGNNLYADRAIYFIQKWLNELRSRKPFDVSSDDYAQLYETIGLGYDWLYNYSGFTQEVKDSVISMMNRVFVFGQTSWEDGGGDFEIDPHDSDQFTGGAKVAGIWGAATYGDNDLATKMISRARELWTNYVSVWVLNSIGGVWPEGSQYSYNTLFYLFAYTETERTANDVNLWNDNPEIKEFPKNVIKSLLYLTAPTNDHVLTYNSQEDDNSQYWNRRNHSVAIASYIAENLGFQNEAAYGRYWIKELSPENIEMNIWKLFLWYDPNKPHINYFEAGLPKAYFSEGLDWLFVRSDWTINASYSTFNAGWTNVDHQFMDGGNFNIFRKGEYLTKPTRHYDFVFTINNKTQRYDGEANNIMLIKSDYEDEEYINAMGSPELFMSEGEANIEKHKISFDPFYTYAYANLGSSYNRIYDEWGGNSQRVKFYAREFVQISPDLFIIFDKVRTTDNGWTKYILHSLTEPEISGNLIIQQSESGSQKLYNKTLFPQAVSITKINEAEVWTTANGLWDDWMIPPEVRKWHVAIETTNTDSVNMLNIIETTDNDTQFIEGTEMMEADNVQGAYVSDWVVLFSRTESENKNIAYQFVANSGSVKNLVCDLEPNYAYEIEVNNTHLALLNAKEDGTIFFEIDSVSGTVLVNITQHVLGVENNSSFANSFELSQNYPNPFNPTTTIKYSIPSLIARSEATKQSTVKVTLAVYNVLGQKVGVLVNKRQTPGNHSVQFNAKNLPSGVYFYRLQAGNFVATKKMILMK